MNSSYYEVLELTKDADPDTIFRRFLDFADINNPRHYLGRQHHEIIEPMETFKKACEAFDILSNPQTRAIYDERGVQGLNEELQKGTIENPLPKDTPIENFAFHDSDKSYYTMSVAEKLFKEACEKKGLCDMKEDQNLMKDPEFFEQLKKDMDQNKNASVSGSVTEYSKIVGEGGKIVEVSKTSKLNPEGNIETCMKETFTDEKGEKTSKEFHNQSSNIILKDISNSFHDISELIHEEAAKGISN